MPKPCLKRQRYGQIGSNGFDFQEQIHNSFLAPVNANGLGVCIIQCAKVDLRQGKIGSRGDFVDKALQRFLVDDDLFHCFMWLRE